jgi:hypothetical protein
MAVSFFICDFKGLCPLTPTKNLALQAVPKKGAWNSKKL